MAKKVTKKVEKRVVAKKEGEIVGAVSPKDDRKNIDTIRLDLLKKFGANSVRTGADLQQSDYGRISTGSIALDLGVGGGIPIGRVTNIAGLKSTGKSSITDHITAHAQKQHVKFLWTERKVENGREIINTINKEVKGLRVAMLDVEGTKVMEWIENNGVNMKDLIYVNPIGMEETLQMIHVMQEMGDVNVGIIDSIETLSPVKERESESGDTFQMGIKPKLLGEFYRKFSALNNSLVRQGKLPFTLIVLNQIREKIGVTYGDNTFLPGGGSTAFYASLDIRLRRGDWISVGSGENKEIIGHEVRFKTEKNKTYRQGISGSFDFYFGDGDRVKAGHIDNFKSTIMEAIAYGVIERAGAWFKYEGNNIGQGAEKTLDYLVNNPDVYEEVKSKLYSIINKGE